MKFSELSNGSLFYFVGGSAEMKMKTDESMYFSFEVNKNISIYNGNFGPYCRESEIVSLGSMTFSDHEINIHGPNMQFISKIPMMTNHIPLRAGMKFIDDGDHIYHIDQIDGGIFKLMCHQTHNRVLDEKFSENNVVEEVIKAYARYANLGPLKFYTGK